jgi:hypothetical protein
MVKESHRRRFRLQTEAMSAISLKTMHESVLGDTGAEAESNTGCRSNGARRIVELRFGFCSAATKHRSRE